MEEEATLDTSLRHTVPTAIGCIPPPGLTKGVKGALAIYSLSYYSYRSELILFVPPALYLNYINLHCELDIFFFLCLIFRQVQSAKKHSLY